MTQNSSLEPPQSLSSSKLCVNCNTDDHWILHNVGFRVESRKLCTSCVLKLHLTSFCPTCFNLHDPNSLNPAPYFSSSSSSSSSSNNRNLTCLKCSSVSHITCVPPNTPKSPYLCPPCSNPSFKFFDFKKPRKLRDQNPQSDGSVGGGGGGGDSNSKKVLEDQQQFLDERAAKVLLLAAKIAAISMNKLVASARSDVERKVKDAALARKRAKEAIDHVMSLSSKLTNVRQQRDVVVSGPGSNAGPVKLENNGRAHNVGGTGGEKSENYVGNGNGTMTVVQSNGGSNNDSNNNHVTQNTS